ncbi:phage portal protein [Bifidobacterium sp. UTCIF-39]|uniref:phage portal protein n=1 Tax=Bifidobacterium sp. UTCIF-39 TaxID=1465359 RepID=UPI00112D6BCD|nr:phage portal protein [Bifidobacterium sp. UTCIF-39]TPF97570.1 phage portal protein [Bifidobacterium sp. UTCIF-39]
MGLLDNLLSRNAASIMMKSANADPPTIIDATPNVISWPTDDEFAGIANGMYCREYAVRVVVDFIVRQLASLPFKVYRRNDSGDAEEARDSELSRLLKRPSRLPGMSRYRFLAGLLHDMLMEDRWVCTLGLDPNDEWTLRRIPPNGYSLTANGFGEITQITVSSTEGAPGRTYTLPSPNVILDVGYIDGLRLGDPVTGVLRPLLAEARSMAAYRKSIAANAARTPAYVFRPKEMRWETQEDYDDFVNSLRNYQAGGGREGAWLPLRDGMEIRSLDLFKPVDMEDIEAREKINEQVALAFHISPENIGFRTGTNSNIAAYKEKLWNVELLPYLVAFEEALNMNLPAAVGEPDCYIRANLDAKLRGTMETQFQALSTATGRPFMSTNQARDLFDWPKIPGGDEIITPLNVTVGGQPSPQDGGQTQNAQQGASPNGKQAMAMIGQFQRLYQYDAGFRQIWDSMTRGDHNDETRPSGL